jgi:hypothetical protein
VVRQALSLVVIAIGLGREPGCGGVDDPDGGTNAPCTRSSDCGTKLACLEGVCRDPDAGAPGGGDGGRPIDASSSGDASDGGG